MAPGEAKGSVDAPEASQIKKKRRYLNPGEKRKSRDGNTAESNRLANQRYRQRQKEKRMRKNAELMTLRENAAKVSEREARVLERETKVAKLERETVDLRNQMDSLREQMAGIEKLYRQKMAELEGIQKDSKTENQYTKRLIWGGGDAVETVAGKELHLNGWTLIKLDGFRDEDYNRCLKIKARGRVIPGVPIGVEDNRRMIMMRSKPQMDFCSKVLLKIKEKLGMDTSKDSEVFNPRSLSQKGDVSSHVMYKPSYLLSEEGCGPQEFHLDNSIKTMQIISSHSKSFNCILSLGDDVHLDVLGDSKGKIVSYPELKDDDQKYRRLKTFVKQHKRMTIRIPKWSVFIFRYDYIHAGSEWKGPDNMRVHIYLHNWIYLKAMQSDEKYLKTYWLEGGADEVFGDEDIF